MATTYNEADMAVFDHHTYVICGDGCLQEGVSSEASSLAGHLGLGKLIVLYDDNLITIDGSTDLSFTEDVSKRYESYGWHVQTVGDVANGLGDLRSAVEAAKAVADRPSIIKVRTAIGYGSPAKQGKSAAHGAPIGADELAITKKAYGLDPEKSFQIDADVQEVYTARTKAVEAKKAEWDALFAKYKAAYPAKAAEIERRFNHEVGAETLDKLPTFVAGKDKDLATRKFSELCLNALAGDLPELMGGSADLTPSNLTTLKCSGDFQKATPGGRYLRFGVREHGMAAICNGLYAYGCYRPFCATFLNFAGYALGSIRLSALSRFGVLYIMTHDSIGLGEDGPTHQPTEMLESLRSMPNINVFRPADGNETSAAYRAALSNPTTPAVICCSRSTVKSLEKSTVDKALKGAYVVAGDENGVAPDLVVIGTGSEVGACVEAATKLTAAGVNTRVVSMPCQELFLAQDQTYQKSVLPGNVPTLSVEASTVHGWHRFSHAQIALTQFGLSGPGGAVFKHFGFGVDNIEAKGKALVEFYEAAGAVPDLSCRPIFNNIQDDGVGHH